MSFIVISCPFRDLLERNLQGHLRRIGDSKGVLENSLKPFQEAEIVEPEPEEPEQQTVGLIGTEHTGSSHDHRLFIGDCRSEFRVDCDGDGKPEDICVQSMIEGKEGHIPKHYLLVDVYKDKNWILRQKLELGFYWEERFFDFVDLDEDGEAELVTQVRLGPNCAGCDAYRVYGYSDCAFYNALNVLNLEPHDDRAKAVLKMLDRIDPVETVGFDRSKRRGELAVCNDEDFFKEDCAPWLLLSEGKTLLIHTLTYRDAEINYIKRRAGVLITEILQKGVSGRQRFFEYPEEPDEASRSALGFLKTHGGKVHLLTTINHIGTSSGYPLLEVLELQGLRLKPVGEFSGFYHHVIPERLIDFDQDGTTEIVYVAHSVWPPGGAHADEIPIYGIAEYRKGKYTEAGKKQGAASARINRFFEQKLSMFSEGNR